MIKHQPLRSFMMPKVRGKCTIEGCDRPHYGKGFCSKHWQRYNVYGDPLAGGPERVRGRVCGVEGCDEKAAWAGYCTAHAHRFDRHGDPLGGGVKKHEAWRYIEETVLPHKGDECLIWPYGKSGTGYATSRKAKDYSCLVHRYVCAKTHGEPTEDKPHAAHNCGNGALGCVNPNHIEWKSIQDNVHDKERHGTQLKGSQMPMAKLTEEDVRYMRSVKGIVRVGVLADQFGVSNSVVSEVLSGKIWRHV